MIQEEKDGRTLVRDKRARLLLACNVVIFTTLLFMFSGILQKDLFKGSEV